MQTFLVLAVATTLAWVNGANDVSKSIATLVGSGVTDYRRAVAWGTTWTGVGGLLAAVLGAAMVSTFGNGLIAHTQASFGPALATLVGATAWVLIATRTGLPVSTTHAIIGSLVGVATVAYGASSVQWSALSGKVALPLLVSPAVALLAAAVLSRATRASTPAKAHDCLCLEVTPLVSAPAGPAVAKLAAPGVAVVLTTGTSETCAVARPRARRLSYDRIHWLTSGATSLARGLNDAPKMVAVVASAFALTPGQAPSQPALFVIVTLAMVAGSALAGRRVTDTLASKVTRMDHREGLCVNLVTAVLVATGARFGMPMSTTHVAAGGLFGTGFVRGTLNRKALRDIVLAWVVTLPGAALLGISAERLFAWWGW